jgi:hypothetical protein
MDPDSELNDAACELLADAQWLSSAAADDHIEAALPATLGCMAAALGAPTVGCAAMGRNIGAAQRDRSTDSWVPSARRMAPARRRGRTPRSARLRNRPAAA